MPTELAEPPAFLAPLRSFPGTCHSRSAPTFPRTHTHSPATEVLRPRVLTTLCCLCFVLHLLTFQSSHINSIPIHVGGGRRRGTSNPISWVTCSSVVVLSPASAETRTAGAGSFYVGRKKVKVQHQRAHSDNTQWFLPLRLIRDSGARASLPRELTQA